MKIVKKTRKTLKIEKLAVLMLVFSTLTALGSALFLRSYNISLSVQVQEKQGEIAVYKSENDAYKVAIQDLSNKDRVISMAEMEGLAMNQGNIVTISNGE